MAVNASSDKGLYRYFLYSRAQHAIREETDLKLGKTFKPGEVLVNGRWRQYTQISATPSNQFSDSVIVAKGYLSEMKYTNFTSQWKVML